MKIIQKLCSLDYAKMWNHPEYTHDEYDFLLNLFIFLLMIIVTFSVFWVYPLVKNCRLLQKFYCAIGWHCHKKDYVFNYFDGVADHCTCKWCGKKGYVIDGRRIVIEKDQDA